jgi:hypothetical protein
MIEPLGPGAKTFTVAISPPEYEYAVIAAPIKLIFDIEFAEPTRNPSSKILIPFTRTGGFASCQYLS